METKTFKKGEIIFKQGELSDCMYDILWGEVGIYADYGTPEEKLLTTLETERFFGEMGMIEGRLRSATAVALEKDTRVKVITPETFDTYFKENPAKVLLIMQNMSHRIRELTRDYLEACRAVAEAVETEKTGKEKSSWFKEKEIDIPNRAINVKLSDEELAARPQQPLTRDRVVSKALRAYAQSVSSADKGGVRMI